MNKMNSQNISDNLINAMDIIMNHGLDKAKFDKTIPVQIIKCIDSRKGIYRVKHQDAVYNATAATTDTQYKEGDEVYITIPEGDMSKNKKIVGEVAAATETHNIKDSDTLNKYYNVGSSVVNSGIEEFGLCSYTHCSGM